MIRVAESLRDIDFSKLTELYEQDIEDERRRSYPYLDICEGRIQTENDLYGYLKDCFFKESEGRYFVNIAQGRYASAVRLEAYKDGFLLNALMTQERYRRKGYASVLLAYVLSSSNRPIYSHIHRKNRASIKIHEKFGFIKLLDHAVLLDGSVRTDHITYIKTD